MLNFLMLLMIAISLSMDTFSLSIIYGTIGIDSNKQYFLSIIVGLFHFFMPLIGNLIGESIMRLLIMNTQIIVGIIFIVIAVQMINQKEEVSPLVNSFGVLLFGLTVSIDSFSVGIGLSSISKTLLLAYFLFAITSLTFTFLGLKFGKKLGDRFGRRAKIVGAAILIIIGLSYIF